MRKVIFYCNWGESPAEILERYRKQTPGCSAVWKDIQGIDNPRQADVFIVLQGLLPGDEVDVERSILIDREPDFIEKPKPHPFRHSIKWSEGHCGIVWWLSKSYDELAVLPYPEKKQMGSCIVSSKHRHRNRFVKSLYGNRWFSQGHVAPVMDLYGRGHRRLLYGKCYKGELGGGSTCKLAGLLPYKYSMVLENSQQPNYWTEKLADAYLAWCVPLYWGCPNLSDYFDPRTYREVDLNYNASQINEILNLPIDSEVIDKLDLERKKILNEYNIWETVRSKIEVSFS